MMVKVKICGIRTVTEAMMAISAGADAIGFNFWHRSKRHVTPDQAKAIRAALPPFVTPVALFVDAQAEDILETVAHVGMDCVQLHGFEPPRLIERLHGLQVIKAVPIRNDADLRRLEEYRVSAFLLDAFSPGMPGGTGKTIDWELARQASARAKIILAGGLTPDNVAEAVRTVRPYAVDVASGVEKAPGVKSRKLVTQFVREAKGVEL
jgi:phosphoribosylanthranilate isomerase